MGLTLVSGSATVNTYGGRVSIRPPAGQTWVLKAVLSNVQVYFGFTNGTIDVPYPSNTTSVATRGDHMTITNDVYFYVLNTGGSVATIVYTALVGETDEGAPKCVLGQRAANSVMTVRPPAGKTMILKATTELTETYVQDTNNGQAWTDTVIGLLVTINKPTNAIGQLDRAVPATAFSNAVYPYSTSAATRNYYWSWVEVSESLVRAITEVRQAVGDWRPALGKVWRVAAYAAVHTPNIKLVVNGTTLVPGTAQARDIQVFLDNANYMQSTYALGKAMIIGLEVTA